MFEFFSNLISSLYKGNMENKLHEFYKKSNLFDGYYKDGQVLYDKKRHQWNYFNSIVNYLLVLNHAIVFIFDNDMTKKNLIFWKLADGYGSRILNLFGGFIVLLISLAIPVYQKFNKYPENFKYLAFMFCFNVNEMQSKFCLSRSRSKNQIKRQTIYFNITQTFQRNLFVTYITYFSIIFYKNFNFNYFELQFLNNLVLIFKIISFILFVIIYGPMSARFILNFIEALLSIYYLTNRLNDLNDEIMNLFSTKHYYRNQKILDNKLMIISRDYNTILRSQKIFNKHINRTIIWSFNLNTMSIAYPCVLLFDGFINSSFIVILFNCSNYLSILSLFFLLTIHNSYFLHSNKKFLRSLSYLKKYTNAYSTIRIQNLLTLNSEVDSLSFNYFHIHNYTSSFLLFWIIESLGLILLVWQTSQ